MIQQAIISIPNSRVLSRKHYFPIAATTVWMVHFHYPVKYWGFELRLESGELRFYEPQVKTLNHEEEAAARLAEQARQEAEQARAEEWIAAISRETTRVEH